jgi:hypothetical protein
MFVNYDPTTGNVLATLNGADIQGEDWLEVADQDLGELGDWKVIEGQLVRASLDAMKGAAIRTVNDRIGDIRRVYITDIPGQDMIYLSKEQEAKAYILDEDPDLANYPFIAAEVGITGETPYQIAQIYLFMAQQLRLVGPQLEMMRLGAVAQIEQATSAARIEAVLAAL